jgi:RteC protein.
MDYFILTDTNFFRQITDDKDSYQLTIAYREFIELIFDLYAENINKYELLLVMTYTEAELRSLCESYDFNSGKKEESESLVYTRKALWFIRRMLIYIQPQRIPLSLPDDSKISTLADNYRWTGSTVELVEFIYGLKEMCSINNGETPITELVSFISSQFGIEIKDCYSAYIDIKRRKNDSRTYYLDKMRERLNLRMQLDDDRELRRKR